ncbi:hypothetical protein SCAR479_05733 [Seiridium cardinale]|uniref:Uncharacterized protein n=1 Tax=Seiridium cardinale TaxID=138064 RepID=A0ABR2XVV3_9PEZI
MALGPWTPYFLAALAIKIYLLIGLCLHIGAAEQESWHQLRRWHRCRSSCGIGLAYIDVVFWPLIWTGLLIYTLYYNFWWMQRAEDGVDIYGVGDLNEEGEEQRTY